MAMVNVLTVLAQADRLGPKVGGHLALRATFVRWTGWTLAVAVHCNDDSTINIVVAIIIIIIIIRQLVDFRAWPMCRVLVLELMQLFADLIIFYNTCQVHTDRGVCERCCNFAGLGWKCGRIVDWTGQRHCQEDYWDSCRWWLFQRH